MNRPFGCHVATFVVTMASIACGSSSGPDANETTVASVSITGAPTSELVATETAQLSATARDNTGSIVAGALIQWASSASSVATVDGNGLVTAVGEGTASITASTSQQTAVATINVAAGGIINPAGGAITFLSGNASLVIPAAAVTQPTRVTVTPATVPPNVVVMQGTAFTISPPTLQFARIAVSTIRYNATAIPTGLAETAISLYEATSGTWTQRLGVVDATAKTLTTNIVRGGTYGVVVLPVEFVQLHREFRNRALAVGQTIELRASFFDVNTRELFGRAPEWRASSPSRATVDASGRVTGLTTGDATIVATTNGKADSVTLTIVARPAADWSGATDWTMNGGNAGRNGYVPVTVDPAAIRLLWDVGSGVPFAETSLGAFVALVTGGGRVFLSSFSAQFFGTQQPYQAAFNGQTGARIWQRTRSATAFAYAQGNVYFQGEDSLWALNGADGSTRFRVAFPGPFSFLSDSPLVTENGLFMTSNGVHRFDLTTGAKVYHTAGVGPVSSTAATNAAVYFSEGGGKGLSALNPATGSVMSSTNAGGCIASGGANVVLGSTNNAIISCNLAIESWDLTTRTRSWLTSTAISGTPAAANGVIYLNKTQPNSLDARRESDGSLLWSFQPVDQLFTPLDGKFILTRNLLIVSVPPTSSGNADFNSVWIMDLASQKVIYRIDGSGNLALSKEGILYVATNDQKLRAYALK